MKAVRTVAILALVSLGLSAILGAIPLIVYPTRQPWKMPQNLLQHTPFHSFLMSGIILLVANGLLSLWVLWLTVHRESGYSWWVGAQGCVLLGWLIVEVVMLRFVMFVHYLYGAVGLVLVVAGLALIRS